jgi:hypothetical protein
MYSNASRLESSFFQVHSGVRLKMTAGFMVLASSNLTTTEREEMNTSRLPREQAPHRVLEACGMDGFGILVK